eukprot:505952-Prymnesium_polylepis.1
MAERRQPPPTATVPGAASTGGASSSTGAGVDDDDYWANRAGGRQPPPAPKAAQQQPPASAVASLDCRVNDKTVLATLRGLKLHTKPSAESGYKGVGLHEARLCPQTPWRVQVPGQAQTATRAVCHQARGGLGVCRRDCSRGARRAAAAARAPADHELGGGVRLQGRQRRLGDALGRPVPGPREPAARVLRLVRRGRRRLRRR